MEFFPTEIPDVISICPIICKDKRGDFLETYRHSLFSMAGIEADFVQDNHAGSKRGVLRGLHYQVEQSQGKLIRIISGKIYDVAVDLRKNSPTFGKHIGLTLTDQEKRMLWIPPGFAHGYYVISERAEVSYKTTAYYAPEWERTIIWDDPTLGIKWPLLSRDHPLLSETDRLGTPFIEADYCE